MLILLAGWLAAGVASDPSPGSSPSWSGSELYLAAALPFVRVEVGGPDSETRLYIHGYNIPPVMWLTGTRLCATLHVAENSGLTDQEHCFDESNGIRTPIFPDVSFRYHSVLEFEVSGPVVSVDVCLQVITGDCFSSDRAEMRRVYAAL